MGFEEDSEDKPLLENEDSVDLIDEKRRGTFTGSVLNLLTCAVGSGILSLPYAFNASGLVFGTALLFFVSALNFYSLHLLILSAHTVGKTTYQDVAIVTYGKKFGTFFVNGILFLTTFGSLTGITIIMGDLLRPPVCQWSGHGANCDAAGFYANRIFLSAIMLVVIAPLALRRTFHEFAFSSFLAIASVAFLVFVVVFRSIQFMTNLPKDWKPPGLGPTDLLGVIDAVPLLAFALGCHIQIIPIFSELRPSTTMKSQVGYMDTVAFTSNCTSTLMYLVVSFFGHFQFGGNVNQNILLNYPAWDTLVTVARLLMAFHVGLAYPVVMWPCRNVLNHLLFGVASTDPAVFNSWRARFISTFETFGIMLTTFALAVLIPDIAIVFGFIGCIGSMFANFILPTLFFIKLHKEARIIQKLPAVALLVFGIIIGISGTGSLTYQTIETFKSEHWG